jgi:hypothetical protein
VAERYFPPVAQGGRRGGRLCQGQGFPQASQDYKKKAVAAEKGGAPPKAAKKVKKVTKKVGAKKRRPPPRLPEEEGDRQLKLSSDEGYCDEEDGYCEAPHKARRPIIRR